FWSPFYLDHPYIMLPALMVFASALVLRVMLLIRFEAIYDKNPRLWKSIKISAIALTSIVWGLFSSLALFFYETSWTPLLAAASTSAICAGGLMSLSMNTFLSRLHVSAILLPNVIASLLVEGYGMAVFFTTYLLYCLMQSKYIHRSYWESRINAIRLNNETQQRLHELTYHDSLTHLPNRELFYDRVQQAINDAKRRQTLSCVMIVGLDRFNKINDTFGHQTGDKLLIDVASRIKATLRENDTIARYSGDTFAVALTNMKDARDAGRVASKIQDDFSQPFELDGLEVFVTASIGISLYPTDAGSVEQLIQNAESTMYRSKEEGGNKYQYYEPNINNESIERLKLETRLRRALERNEFVLYYQPKVSLITGKLSGFEALLRWSPSEEEMISPARFIPILEDTGLIVPVGEWVLRTACQQAKQWQVYLPDNAKMAVNLSARQFQDANLSQLVADVLDETGLDAEYLELEITESMLMEDTDHTIKILQQLHDMGIHLSIDDFGTGYSSLAYLKRMPIGTLKIDRSFVKDITTDSNDATVVQTIIAMAHTLKLRVIAEGSETADQIQFLREQQCDETQGFYFSRPLPANQLRPMLEDGQELLSYNFSDKSMQENNCVPITKKQT
ncbi:MAG: EAL domain-containing protein, partial [Thioalkalispiraceae bacterium]